MTNLWFQKYRIIRILGEGGTATVFLAEHEKLQCQRAIKRIPKENNYHEQLMNEARILKNLKHPNIPVIYDLEEDESYSYIIEEFIEGKSLKAFRLCQSNIQEKLVIHFAIQICDLFQYIHAIQFPILYLDLKPDNILLQDNILKLIDFGAAIFREEAENRMVSFGSKDYAAPEQYTVGYLDERSDIYAIGKLLLFLVTAKTYPNEPQGELGTKQWSGCSKELGYIIDKCLKHSPLQRFQNVVQLKEKLLALRMIETKDCKLQSKQSLTIAIAGSQSRIGTTHISVLITSYINRYMEPAILMERNVNPIVWELLKYHPEAGIGKGVVYKEQCPIIAGSDNQINQLLDNYRIRVCDYGVLTEDNLTLFATGDIKLFVLGAKEWELSYAHKALKELFLYKGIHYLFNFTDGREFLKAKNQMEKENCIRVPYYPNPCVVEEGGAVKEFVEAFWERRNEKKTHFIKKHLWFR